MEGSQTQMMLTPGWHQRYGGNKHINCLHKERMQSFVSGTQRNEEFQYRFTANRLFSLSPDYFSIIAPARKPIGQCLPGKPV